ncbi:hypothetical protein LWI29_029607 [Acer saccharum]|uniref:Phosphoribosyltransferase domain-containing protein n=1 Tax=Acer saccharum TaxID=4024 RepID=A0AA39SZR7_ACESA|nr:hypothetical protein LWI29_029607 [Acer saccharum]
MNLLSEQSTLYRASTCQLGTDEPVNNKPADVEHEDEHEDICRYSADADVRLARRIRRDTVEKGRDIGTVLDQLIYEKLPQDISERHVLLLDPILGTGNSAVQAISLLISKGVPEPNIIFLNLKSAPQSVHVVCKSFPRIKTVTSEIDIGLNEDFRVVPGMGEFGDRYFGTDDDEVMLTQISSN